MNIHQSLSGKPGLHPAGDHPLTEGRQNDSTTVAGIFTYGTLMRGESRFAALEAGGLQCVLLAQTTGRLFDCGSWPALQPGSATASGGVVFGEFVIPNDLTATLALLDRVEGFYGPGHPDNLFHRTLAWVDVDNGRLRPAWVYAIDTPMPSARPIPSGDWREYTGRKAGFVRDLVAAHARGINEFTRQVAWATTPPVSRIAPEDNDYTWEELMSAVSSGEVAERRLARVSGRWTACP